VCCWRELRAAGPCLAYCGPRDTDRLGHKGKSTIDPWQIFSSGSSPSCCVLSMPQCGHLYPKSHSWASAGYWRQAPASGCKNGRADNDGPGRELNCPNCRVEPISALRRIFSSAEYPVVCGNCTGMSLPGALPSSELQRVAIVAPLFLLLLGGLNFLPLLRWVECLLLVLSLTFTGIAGLQLSLQLQPATAGDLQRSRAFNLMASIAIAALGVLSWCL